jgi:hypothetical protein
MGKYNATQDQIPQEIQGAPFGYWSSPAYFSTGGTNYVYAAGTQADAGVGDYLKQYTLSNGLLSTTPVAMSPKVLPDGATPSVSANVSSNGIVWIAERQESLDSVPGKKALILQAYDATNVASLLYSSTQNAARDTAGLETKFMVPLVANGRVYVGTQTEVDVYSVFTATLLPSSVTFSLVPIGNTSSPETVTLTNVGTTALGITSIGISGQVTKTTTCGTSLQPGAKCTISVSFAPTSDGVQSGKLTVVDSGGTQTVTLSGTATPLKFTPASVNFGTIKVGTKSAAKSVTVTNVGATTLTLTSIVIGGTNAGDFAIASKTCGSTLAAGATCTVSTTFTPTATGARSGNVTINDNDPITPQKILLSGTGS